MIMVSVSVGEGKEPVVGLLLDTHLMTMSGAPSVTMGLNKQLVETPGKMGLQSFGVVATDKGFIVGPLASMTPIMNPDDAAIDAEMKMYLGEEGDEVEASNSFNDPPKWQITNEACVDTRAPNPMFPAHRQYRREK